MLSRAAERMYWFGRQVERAENISRLISVNANLILDLPRMGKQIWGSLVDITGSHESYYNKYQKAEERHITRFILVDESNPASLYSTIKMARENARVSREIMPSESWEKINEFYLYVKKNAEKSINREGRHKFLNVVTSYCNLITGILFGGMSHGSAYSFIRIGRNLERADMTTRIVDVGCLNLIKQGNDLTSAYADLLWMNVLRSLSAYQMYRQHVKDRVNGEDVVAFTIKDLDFPRSTAHCLNEINNCFSRLPKNDVPLRAVTHTQRLINEVSVDKLMESGLHEFIDEIQIDIAELHTQIGQTWFGHEIENHVMAAAASGK